MEYKCIICLDTLNNSSYYKLSCNHVFHYNCIKDWCVKYRNRYCPFCKKRQCPVKIKKRMTKTIINKKITGKKRKKEY